MHAALHMKTDQGRDRQTDRQREADTSAQAVTEIFVQADAAARVDAVPHNTRREAAVKAPHALGAQNVGTHADCAALLGGSASTRRSRRAVRGRRHLERTRGCKPATAVSVLRAQPTRRAHTGWQPPAGGRHLALQLEPRLGSIDGERYALRHRGRCGAPRAHASTVTRTRARPATRI
jgi:hypothetical protein